VISKALTAGLIVGTLDIIAACISAYLLSGVGPARVLRFVASGALGEDAFSGGAGTAALGLLFHFVIAISWTVAFFLLRPKIQFLANHEIAAGLGYGLLIWLVMTFVVVPLSRVPPRPFNLTAQAPQIVIHMVIIGLTISLLAKRWSAPAA
jgi:hypothetical protein